MNDDQTETLGPLLDRIEALEAMVLRLEHRVGELSGIRPMSVGTTPTEDKEPKLPGPRTPEELEELAQWVDRLQERYATNGDWLRPCWWRHGLVVEELAALLTAWLGAYDDEGTVASSATLDWHEAAERCRERVRQAVNTGPGCSYVSHHPDESITEDRRWIEESRETIGGGPGQTTIAAI